MSRVEYYAGFFDGEGSIGLYRNGQRTWHLRTQLTQNINGATTDLLNEMKRNYGGNLTVMRSKIYLGGGAFNWQLNGHGAVTFLSDVFPFLRLKKEQAEYAMAWHSISQKPSRDARGRMCGYEKDRAIDIGAGALIKALKRADIDAVMEAQTDLVDIVHTLKQVLCVKG